MERIARLPKKPKLMIVSVGERADSLMYIGAKKTYGESLGVEVAHHPLSPEITQDELIQEVQKLQANSSVDGIICQLPFPAHINPIQVIDHIDPLKDADALSQYHVSRLLRGEMSYVPATTRGIFALLETYKFAIAEKNVTVIGRSDLVGKPTALMCLALGATVTIAHSQTKDLATAIKDADIVISATGKKNLITGEMVHADQIIIDVGINKDGENQIHGDVNWGEVASIVQAISPVPGGVGPMTVHSLFENLIDLVEKQNVV
jgi:methylenetetrahydrofolate dehydrogenase (NADP+)/methenyltetrahydrofolate cyclohydrolase